MIPAHTRKQVSSALSVAGIGQAMIAGGSLLARAVSNLPSHQLDAVSYSTFYGSLVFGAGVCAWGARRLGSTPRSSRPVLTDPRSTTESQPAAAADERPSVEAPADPFVARLQEVIAARPIAVDTPERDEQGDPISFTVRATRPGWFTNDRVRTDIYTLLTKSIDGIWNMHADPRTDTLSFTIKAGFPAVIAPPVPKQVPQSTAEVRHLYPDFRLRLGVTATGEELAIDLTKIPHALVIGGTGTGKSVFARGLIESFRTAGWMLFLGDGKGTDYEGLHGQTGVVAISQTTSDHVRLVRMVCDELKGRQADAKTLRRGRATDPFQRPPLLLLLDEYATMRAQIKDQYGAEEFEADLMFIARVGREFKIHLFLSTQEAYRDTIPGSLLGNLNLRVSLGPPEEKTIREVFPARLRSEAVRIGGTISKNDRGRSLALITDDEGTNQAVEFQSYFSYSPAETKAPPNPEIAAAWEHFRTAASDRIPLLYPRLWFAVDGPDYGDDLETLYRLPVVVLTGRDGQPLPEASKYDPLSDDYLGGGSGDGSVFQALDELPDTILMPELPAPPATADDESDDDILEVNERTEIVAAEPGSGSSGDTPMMSVTMERPHATDPGIEAVTPQPDRTPKRLIPRRSVGI